MDSIHVEILSTKLIKPSSPTPPHLQCYKLSFFDQIANKELVPLVLLYPPCNNNNSINDAEMDERLEHSFSKILTRVHPAAGRYAEDGCSVLCLDQGVPYTKAKVNCKLDYFLEQVARDGHELTVQLWPHDIKGVDDTNLFTAPIFTVQITKFECGAMAVAISISHPVMDGFTTMSTMFEWANACRLGTPIDKINNYLSFNAGDVFPTRDLSRYFKPPIPQEGSKEDKFLSKRFVIKEAAILKLKEKFASFIDSGALDFKPSRVEMISALLWRALIRASEAINGNLRPSMMGFPLNLRSKVNLPEINKSVGNLVIDVPVKFIPGETQMELQHLVKLIRDAVTKVVASCSEASPDEIVSHVANLYNESFQAPEWGGNDDIDKFTCSSLCRFPMQDADFGLGKPCLMFFGLKDMNMFWLHDTVCRTGVGLQVDLDERHLQLFESDLDLKAFIEHFV
ncbi:acetyl-CoA-benzylalcohol acetyltransferase-like [Lycium ferocissimum]|uniref:acetyl-CoA-benzylalcohol acetyltransferase-like n=1 Tax=Lycium ferocissimum TaxID=112874 RepID=UPI0028150A04|nr:acetyl-CoA-benzylalcohol acetyltransferase-like [Lycium ferocissimum]